MAVTPRAYDHCSSFFHLDLEIICSFQWFNKLSSNMVRLVFIGDQSLKHACAELVTYEPKIFLVVDSKLLHTTLSYPSNI